MNDGRDDGYNANPARDVAQERSDDLFNLEQRATQNAAAQNGAAQDDAGAVGAAMGGGRRGRGYNSDGSIDEGGSSEAGNSTESSDSSEDQQSEARRDNINREERPNSPIKFSGKGGKEGGGKSRLKGFLKKRAATMVIVVIVTGGGVVIFGSQSLEGFAIVNRMIQEFNSSGTVSDLRGNFLIKRMLRTAKLDLGEDSPLKGSIFDPETTPLGDDLMASLKANKMEIKERVDADGSITRVMFAEDTQGRIQPVVGDTATADSLNNSSRNLASEFDVDIEGKTFVDGAIDLDTARATIPDFDAKYTSATIEMTGQNAHWYDGITRILFKNLGITRNRFNSDGEAEMDEAKFIEVAKSEEADDGMELKESKEVPDDDNSDTVKTDDDGNPEIEHRTDSDAENNIKHGESDAEIEVKTESRVKKIVASADSVQSIRCGYLAAAGAVNSIATAAEVMQVLNFVVGFTEAVQKTQAGMGSTAPMSNYMKMLTSRAEDGTTAMQASGMSQLFGGTFNPDDASVRKYNFQNTEHEIMNGKFKIADFSADDFQKCNYGTMATASMSLGADILLTVVPFVGQNGLTKKAVKTVVGSLFKVGRQLFTSIAISTAISMIVQAAIPRLAQFIAKDIFLDKILGADLGNAIPPGGREYMARMHKAHGGAPGDENAVLAYNQATQKVLAHQAKYERETHSPFDASSSYTFLGTLYMNLMPLATSSGTFSSIASSLSSTMVKSLGAILPSAAASTLGNTNLTATFGDCVNSNSGYAAADGYCSEFITSDLSTMGMDFGDVVERLDAMDGRTFKKDEDGNFILDSDGNVQINTDEDTDTMRVITLELTRTTSVGVADAETTSALSLINTGNSTLDTILDSTLNAVPILGTAYELADAATNQSNAPWISGNIWVNSDNNPKWNSEMKYIQRFIEDQSVLESAGVIEKSSVQTAMEEYYEKNPVDQSYEGRLAYLSGMTKEQVIATLDLIDAYNYITYEYDPSEMAPVYDAAPDFEDGRRVVLLDMSNLAVVEVEQPLVAGTSELEREVAFRENKRAVNQSI